MGFVSKSASRCRAPYSPDEKIKKYVADGAEATLTEIASYEESMKGDGVPFVHRYLLIEVSKIEGVREDGINRTLSKRYILAEKTLNKENRYNLVVHVLGNDEADHRLPSEHNVYPRVHHSVSLGPSGIKISFDDLVETLKNSVNRYTLMKYNCWHYVHDIMNKLLVKLSKTPDLPSDIATRIADGIRTMPPLLLPDDATPWFDASVGSFGFSAASGLVMILIRSSSTVARTVGGLVRAHTSHLPPMALRMGAADLQKLSVTMILASQAASQGASLGKFSPLLDPAVIAKLPLAIAAAKSKTVVVGGLCLPSVAQSVLLGLAIAFGVVCLVCLPLAGYHFVCAVRDGWYKP